MRTIGALAAFGMLCGAASPQAATLEDIAAAMGTDKLANLHVAGTGKIYFVGQAYSPGGPWPEARILAYSRVEDYAAGAVSLNQTLFRDPPARGGGGVAIGVEVRQERGLHGRTAWTVAGQQATAAPQLANGLAHDLATSAHGIVKAAIADQARLSGNSFEILRQGQFKARATVNAENLVASVESWISNPVLGDMAVVTTFSGYKDFDGVKVPTRIVQTAGGHPSLDLAVTEARPNAGPVEVPANIAAAQPPGPVTMDKAADGVWHVAGASHHSVAIEMADHVIVIEGPLGDPRSSAVIEAVRKEIPNKPIRAVVATHHHFDHAGGLRAFAAEGIAIAAASAAVPFFEKAYANPRTLAPDRMARSGRTASFQPVGAKHVFSDGTRSVELHELKDNPHCEGLIVAYLPREKILVVADAFSPRAPITRTPDVLNPSTVNLWENITRLGLDVETVLPIHGRMVKVDELKTAAGHAR